MSKKSKKSKKLKQSNEKEFDLTEWGYSGTGRRVPGLTPVHRASISVIETPTNKDEERKKALESVFNLPRTSLSTILPPETDTEKNIVKEFVTKNQTVLSPDVLSKNIKQPYTAERRPGSGPVDVEDEDEGVKYKLKHEVKEQLDFGNDNSEEFDGLIMDIEEEHLGRGKRRRQKMKTRKAVRKNKRKRSTKKRRTSVRRR